MLDIQTDSKDPDDEPSPKKRGKGRPKNNDPYDHGIIDDHSFEDMIDKMVDKRRGLRKSVCGEPQHSSTEMMKEYKKRYANTFLIQIAPLDFPKEQFFDFVFPKPLEAMEIIANESSEGYVSLVDNIHSGEQCYQLLSGYFTVKYSDSNLSSSFGVRNFCQI